MTNSKETPEVTVNIQLPKNVVDALKQRTKGHNKEEFQRILEEMYRMVLTHTEYDINTPAERAEMYLFFLNARKFLSYIVESIEQVVYEKD